MRLLPFIVCSISVAACAATTEEVLAKLDRSAPKFQGMASEVTRVSYTKVIDDKTVEEGRMALRKLGPRDIQILIELTKPDARKVAFRGRKAEIFYPKLRTVQEYDLGKRSDLVDQFLSVGFGTTGRELRANYTVKSIGDETIEGENSHRLELTPADAAQRQQLRSLELWISASGGYPVQQKFTQPSGDYYLVTYTDVKLNPGLGDEAFRLNLPKGTKREFPQK